MLAKPASVPAPNEHDANERSGPFGTSRSVVAEAELNWESSDEEVLGIPGGVLLWKGHRFRDGSDSLSDSFLS